MSDNQTKRALPSLANFDKLKKEAKARLAAMRARLPSARLAEAQHVLAREYGFESWAALKLEVERRNADPALAELRNGKARGALFRALSRGGQEEKSDPQSPAPFFRTGLAVTVSFIVLAIVGIALVFATTQEGPARFHALVRFFAGRAP